jgi:hypothetical protein
MRTSGQGSESLLILSAVGVLLGVGVVLAGGPREFLGVVDGALQKLAEGVTQWIRLWV